VEVRVLFRAPKNISPNEVVISNDRKTLPG
jgi:hypothetical protein